MLILVHVRSLVFPFSCLVFLIQLTSDMGFHCLRIFLLHGHGFKVLVSLKLSKSCDELREGGMGWRQLNHAS